MLIYEHSISRKKHPSHGPFSHVKTMRPKVVGSCLSGLWGSNGCDPTRLLRPVTGGFMLGSETGTSPFMGVKLTDRRNYCESSSDEITIEKNFGGA